MSEELGRSGNLPAIASGALIDIAEQAEKRVEAIIKIKKVALMVTNKYDWTNQQDRPYLQVSGSEKIANLFNISWRIDEPRLEFEDDGHFTYTFKGEFSLGGRTIEVEGSRSSKDPFFKKYDWTKGEDGKSIKTEKPISAIDKRDVKMAALTNLLGNGISRILGIRNLQWSDLQEFAGIKKEEVAGIEYRKSGEKQTIQEPQKKSNEQAPPPTESPILITTIEDVQLQTGTHKDPEKKGQKWEMWVIAAGDKVNYRTFSRTIGEAAYKEIGTGLQVQVNWKQSKYGREIVSMEPIERIPGSEG